MTDRIFRGGMSGPVTVVIVDAPSTEYYYNCLLWLLGPALSARVLCKGGWPWRSLRLTASITGGSSIQTCRNYWDFYGTFNIEDSFE